jgi:hypothetical protein
MSALRICRQVGTTIAVALLVSACFGGSSDEDAGSSNPPPPVGNPPPANSPPTISGTPMTTLRVGENYSFQPVASDPDGDTLSFSIQNRPAWATFSTATGRLSGTPAAGDVGQFSNVRISVSDGNASAQLNAFSIAVNQIAQGSVTLSWNPPTTNADGSPINDLAGYRIYYGRSANDLDATVNITNPGIARYVIDNLSIATWYFSMTSYNATGVESARSQVVSRTLT